MTWTRRLFVRESLRGWVGLVVGPTVYGIGRLLGNSNKVGLSSAIDIGAGSDLAPGMSKTMNFSGERVLVVRDTDGLMHAVSARCTHMGCSIRFEGNSGNGRLACNCHESRFSLSGEVLNGPADKDLQGYRVEERNGRLFLVNDDGVAE